MLGGNCSIELFLDLSKWNTSKLIINKCSRDKMISGYTSLVYSNFINLNRNRFGTLLDNDKYKNCLSLYDVVTHFYNKNI